MVNLYLRKQVDHEKSSNPFGSYLCDRLPYVDRVFGSLIGGRSSILCAASCQTTTALALVTHRLKVGSASEKLYLVQLLLVSPTPEALEKVLQSLAKRPKRPHPTLTPDEAAMLDKVRNRPEEEWKPLLNFLKFSTEVLTYHQLESAFKAGLASAYSSNGLTNATKFKIVESENGGSIFYKTNKEPDQATKNARDTKFFEYLALKKELQIE